MTDVDSTSSPQEETTQAAPAIESTATVEPAVVPETVPNEALEVPAEAQPAEGPTAQIPGNEPLASEPEPLMPPAQGMAVQEQEPPPQAAASVPVAPAPTVVRPAPPFAEATEGRRDLLAKAHATIRTRKQKRLAKILVALDTKGSITNDDVEKLLRVSDATATRYLSALEHEGKIRQAGNTGQAVKYTRV